MGGVGGGGGEGNITPPKMTAWVISLTYASFSSSRNLPSQRDCVTSQKGVCEEGYRTARNAPSYLERSALDARSNETFFCEQEENKLVQNVDLKLFNSLYKINTNEKK